MVARRDHGTTARGVERVAPDDSWEHGLHAGRSHESLNSILSAPTTVIGAEGQPTVVRVIAGGTQRPSRASGAGA
jgi:hypothetical protein